MKGYENMSVPNIAQDTENPDKSRTICKLTELADIALGNEKPESSKQLRQTDVSHEQNRSRINEHREYANETHSCSTSSKTIMPSSINPKLSVNKIIIPERPFKNIGLEEKASITFQKPKTTGLGLLKSLTDNNTQIASNCLPSIEPENSVSTASYSDRDDFDFNSISCDDDEEEEEPQRNARQYINDDSHNRGVKTPTNSNEEPLLHTNVGAVIVPRIDTDSSSNSSCSSRATAKTFENKSLIMGRIFKNNSTKIPAAKSTPALMKIKATPNVKPVEHTTTKADLNQLFDELRGDCNKKQQQQQQQSQSTQPVIKSNNIVTLPKPTRDATMPTTTSANVVRNPVKSTTVLASTTSASTTAATAPATTPATTIKTANVTKNKNNNIKTTKKQEKARKEITKLQTELGMSPKAIEQLIDEGQRKSKRRCAANRPKKLVEMWSSDEYEEFLSTKDVIALIEEKEKLEKEKRKRKSTSTTATATATTTSSTTTTTINNQNYGGILENDEISVQSHKKMPDIYKKSHKEDKTKEKEKEKEKEIKIHKKTHKNKNKLNEKNKNKFTDDNNYIFNMVKNNATATVSTVINDDLNIMKKPKLDDNLIKSNDKIKTHKSHKKNKTHHKKTHKNSMKKSHETINVVSAETDNLNVEEEEQRKRKRKSQTKSKSKSSSNAGGGGGGGGGRQRSTKEKLYYWSSTTSSDVDYNNHHNNHTDDIDDNTDDDDDDDINNDNDDEDEMLNDNYNKHQTSSSSTAGNAKIGGEQYQKHGWIVGDSHKKLVTLLAITKGSNNKKNENRGVKKKISKRKQQQIK